jgi:hypothetical protein
MAVHLSEAFETNELLWSEDRRMSLIHHDNDPAWRNAIAFEDASGTKSVTDRLTDPGPLPEVEIFGSGS